MGYFDDMSAKDRLVEVILTALEEADGQYTEEKLASFIADEVWDVIGEMSPEELGLETEE